MIRLLHRPLATSAASKVGCDTGMVLAFITPLAVAALIGHITPVSASPQPDGRQMMEAMQGMQACMARVDRSALKRLHEQAERAQGEIRSLCRVGNEAGAQTQAMGLARQMASDQNLKMMQACLAQLPQLPMVQAMLPTSKLGVDEPSQGDQPRSICERLK
jgi:hypothetical protein